MFGNRDQGEGEDAARAPRRVGRGLELLGRAGAHLEARRDAARQPLRRAQPAAVGYAVHPATRSIAGWTA